MIPTAVQVRRHGGTPRVPFPRQPPALPARTSPSPRRTSPNPPQLPRRSCSAHRDKKRRGGTPRQARTYQTQHHQLWQQQHQWQTSPGGGGPGLSSCCPLPPSPPRSSSASWHAPRSCRGGPDGRLKRVRRGLGCGPGNRWNCGVATEWAETEEASGRDCGQHATIKYFLGYNRQTVSRGEFRSERGSHTLGFHSLRYYSALI